jgi:5-methylcytosine-specific restriction endonuclease McrA
VTDALVATLGTAWSLLSGAVDLAVSLTPLPAWLVWALAGLWLYGHFDRPVEFAARRVRMRLSGYSRYSEYVSGPVWRDRARRWYAAHGKPPCCVCGTGRDGRWFHLHHVDRFRAGGGHEMDRDLVPICRRCHDLVHRVERRLYPLGVTLRATTWLVRHAALPVRLARRTAAGRGVAA